MANKNVNILINARDNASATFKRVAGAIAGVFAAGKMVSWTRDIINLGDSIGEASQRVGVSAEAWQKLQYAAEQSGASAGQLEGAWRKMQKMIFDAGNGSAQAAKNLALIGLEAGKLKALSPENQFGEIAKRLALVKDSTERAAVAQQLFGESGTVLLPMLANYEEMGKHLENIGGIIRNDVVSAAGDFNDQIKDLTLSLQAMVANSGIIGWLNEVTSAVNELGGATKALKAIAETAAEESDIFSVITGGVFNKAKIRVKPTGEAARTAGATYQEAPTAGEIAQKAEEVAAGRTRAAEVAAAAAARAAVQAVKEEVAPMIQEEAKAPSWTQQQGPQDGAVFRFLSGMGNTIKPAEQTAKATQESAATLKDISAELKKMNERSLGYDLQPVPGL
jgi:hypothetical protein